MINHNIKNRDTNKETSKDTQSLSLQSRLPSISLLQFPFTLKEDQIAAVDAWINNNYRGTILYSTGTGKTEIAFECAKRRSIYHQFSGIDSVRDNNKFYNILPLNTNTNSLPENASTATPDKTMGFSINKNNPPESNINCYFFNILFLVPRISLISQTIKRLLSYGIPEEKIGAYFGERKEIKEIIISTYHSVVRNLDIIRRSEMVIFDEVHLIRDTAKSFSKIFDTVVEDPKKAILGLTATLDESDFKNSTILAVLPPVKRYSIRKAVGDKRLAKPIVIPIKTNLTEKELKDYDTFSTKIKNISNRFKRYDVDSMIGLLKKGGFASGMAKAWFANIRKRKLLLSYAENKLSAAADIISKKFPVEKIMVFSETIESIEKLRDLLEIQGTKSKIIDAKIKTSERQKILDMWGYDFNVLLSLHTLEIGYDVPQVRIEIILATTSNINQVVQRIGRVLRKHEGKDIALIYVIYVSDTKDDNVVELVRKAIKNNSDIENHQEGEGEDRRGRLSKKTVRKNAGTSDIKSNEKTGKDRIIEKQWHDKRVEKAYGIIESSLQGSLIVEQKGVKENDESNNSIHDKKRKTKIYMVKSKKDKDKPYEVDIENKTCSCADFIFRHVKCKHIIATELVLP